MFCLDVSLSDNPTETATTQITKINKTLTPQTQETHTVQPLTTYAGSETTSNEVISHTTSALKSSAQPAGKNVEQAY